VLSAAWLRILEAAYLGSIHTSLWESLSMAGKKQWHCFWNLRLEDINAWLCLSSPQYWLECPLLHAVVRLTFCPPSLLPFCDSIAPKLLDALMGPLNQKGNFHGGRGAKKSRENILPPPPQPKSI
jgi:hypothetical protein